MILINLNMWSCTRGDVKGIWLIKTFIVKSTRFDLIKIFIAQNTGNEIKIGLAYTT